VLAQDAKPPAPAGGPVAKAAPAPARSAGEHIYRIAVSPSADAPDVLLGTPAGIEIADAGTGTVTAAVFTADGRFLWVARRDAGEITRVDVPPRDR
jgi:hypothetical protein